MRRSEGLGLHAAAVRMIRERTRAFSARPVKRFFIVAILARGRRQSRRQRLAFHALRDELGALLPRRRMRAVPRGTRAARRAACGAERRFALTPKSARDAASQP